MLGSMNSKVKALIEVVKTAQMDDKGDLKLVA